MHSNRYTLMFAMAITIVASILLASAATLLKPYQVRNEALDMKMNILVAGGLIDLNKAPVTAEDIESIYEKSITESVINTTGKIVEEKGIDDLDPKINPDLMALYTIVSDGTVDAYILPISGKALWSTVYGYMALSPDLNTIKGVTFYKHGETPGLGGEIEKPYFTDNFKGKKIFNNGELVSVTIVKGKVLQASDHKVDGISGSTLTCNGLNTFILNDLNRYLPYIKSQMKEVN